jgi:hypothetical protein
MFRQHSLHKLFLVCGLQSLLPTAVWLINDGRGVGLVG